MSDDSLRQMSPDRWARIQAILEGLWALPEGAAGAAEREALIAHQCAGDEALASQVRRLFEADQAPSPLDAGLGTDAVRLVASETGLLDDLAGHQVGHYRLVKKLGQGGMGVVYLGERADGAFEHRVAVKLLRSWVGGELEQARFRNEQQVLASLDHPAIASLYDAGRTQDGRAWFIMEYVEGVRITDYCQRHQLSVAERLGLVLEVAQALQYAHRRLIVHRDVKPSNILIDAQGRVKLLDFGIAKLLGEEAGAAVAVTRSDERPMTLEYAAPEQIRGHPVSVQTDVYQLGVLLYELLTGVRPFHREDGDLYGLAREICERGAERPSAALRESTMAWLESVHADTPSPPGPAVPGRATPSAPAALQEKDGASPDRLLRRWRRRQQRRLRGDLDAIVMRALAREADERYPSMEALGADIDAYLGGRPISARPYSFTRSSWLFLRRHPRSNAAVALFVLLLAAWGTTATLQSERLAQAYDLVRAEGRKASQTASFLENIFRSWDPTESPGERILVRDMLNRARQELARELDKSPEVRARLTFVLAGLYKSLGLYREQVELADAALNLRRGLYRPPDERLVETALLLGEGLTETGEFQRARQEFEYALRQAEALDGALPALTGTIEGRLAFALQSIGANRAAESRYHAALGRFREAGATDSPEYASTLANFAALLDTLARFDDALAANDEALQVHEAHYGRRHHEVAVLLNQRGYLMSRLGKDAQARALHEEALGIQLERLSPQHEYVASTRIDLARVLAREKAWDEARGHLEAALQIRTDVYGEINAHTSDARFALGGLLRDMGEYAEAEREFTAARAIDREIFGPAHQKVGMDETRLAAVVHAQGRLEEARRLYEQALQKLPEEFVFRSTTLYGYGKVLIDLGLRERARAYLEQALALRRSVLPDDDPRCTEIADTLLAAQGGPTAAFDRR